MNIRLRIAGVSDAKLVAGLGKETFEETWGPFYSEQDMRHYLESAFTVAGIETQLMDDKNVFLVIEIDESSAGYAKLVAGSSLPEFEGETVCEIERFYFFRQYHGTGAADFLMKAILEKCVNSGCTWVCLGVDINNHRAIRFYTRYGFTVFGKKIFRVGNVEDTDQLMKLELKSVSPRNPSA